jgi:hypothetical protein
VTGLLEPAAKTASETDAVGTLDHGFDLSIELRELTEGSLPRRFGDHGLDPGASRPCSLEALFALHDRRPERESTALLGAHVVDGTLVRALEQNATAGTVRVDLFS